MDTELQHSRWRFSSESFELVPVSDQLGSFSASALIFDGSRWNLKDVTAFGDIAPDLNDRSPIWLHVTGKVNPQMQEELSRFLGLPASKLEFLASPHSRTLVKEFANDFFWTVSKCSVVMDENFAGNIQFDLEVINFFLCSNLLVTRQFAEDNYFAELMEQIAETEAVDCMRSVDEIAISAFNEVLESFVDVLQKGGMRLGQTQSRTLKRQTKEELFLINLAQQISWTLLQSIWPVEHVIQVLKGSKCSVLSKEGRADLEVLEQKARSIIRICESYREVTYDLLDLYSTGVGMRINQITIILTVIATIFLPPTLIAGIYGMNFKIMPELEIPIAYPLCLASMILVSGSLLIWIQRKGGLEV